MVDHADGSPVEESADSDRVTPQGNPPRSRREVLGRRLEALAKRLTSTHNHLAGDWPKQEEVVDYWRNGLQEVQNCVVRCQRLADQCQAVLRGDKGQPLPEFTHKQLDEAIKQFSRAIRLARRDTLAAIHALEGRQKPTMRAALYEKAVDQLAELSERCTGLATQMRGESGLPAARPPAAP